MGELVDNVLAVAEDDAVVVEVGVVAVVEVVVESPIGEGIARDVKGEYSENDDGEEEEEEGGAGSSSHGFQQGPRRRHNVVVGVGYG